MGLLLGWYIWEYSGANTNNTIIPPTAKQEESKLTRVLSPQLSVTMVHQYVKDKGITTTVVTFYKDGKEIVEFPLNEPYYDVTLWGTDSTYAYVSFPMLPEQYELKVYPPLYNLYRLNLENGDARMVFDASNGASLDIDIPHRKAVVYREKESAFFLYDLDTLSVESFPYIIPDSYNKGATASGVAFAMDIDISPLVFSPNFSKVAFALKIPDIQGSNVYIYDLTTKTAVLYKYSENGYIDITEWTGEYPSIENKGYDTVWHKPDRPPKSGY